MSYVVEAPLNSIFTPTVMDVYLRIFNFCPLQPGALKRP